MNSDLVNLNQNNASDSSSGGGGSSSGMSVPDDRSPSPRSPFAPPAAIFNEGCDVIGAPIIVIEGHIGSAIFAETNLLGASIAESMTKGLDRICKLPDGMKGIVDCTPGSEFAQTAALSEGPLAQAAKGRTSSRGGRDSGGGE